MGDYLGLTAKLKAKLSKLIWVCGDEPVLRESAVTLVRTALNLEPHNMVTLFAKQAHPNPDVWADLSQHHVDSTSSRLVVVRDAQHLSDPVRLGQWQSGSVRANIYALFVSDTSWATSLHPEVRKGVTANGLYVDVSLPKGDQQAEAFVAKYAEQLCPQLTPLLSQHLSQVAHRDIAKVRDVCAWLSTLIKANQGWAITAAAIDGLVQRSAPEGFIDSLLSMDKAAAHAAARDVQYVRPVLTTLGHNLLTLEAVGRFVRTKGFPDPRDLKGRSMYVQDVVKGTKIPTVEVERFLDLVRHYDTASLRRRTQALLQAFSVEHNSGVLDVLVSHW